MPVNVFDVATDANIRPITLLTTLAPLDPINRFIWPAASINRYVTSSTTNIMDAVCTCSQTLNRLFSVNNTAANIAPGLAMEGTASGNMAVS